jgi:putative PIN family toxin of toxin-antitoxin system
MIDTNVFISALLFPSRQMDRLMYKIATEHRLVLSSYVVEEILNVTRRKFGDKVETVDMLLSQLPYELVYTPGQPRPGLFEIRDEKDYPVLYSAITEDVDIFITGDKDFDELDLERPEIITPSAFL